MIGGIEVAKLADYLEGRAEALEGNANKRNRQLMRAGAKYIRVLQEQLASATSAPPAKPQVTVRRITFR